MGRDSNRNRPPDLFSVGPPASNKASEPEAAPPSRRVALPKDLPGVVRYLDDRQLDLLLQAAIDESRRCGRSPLDRDAVSKTTDASLSRKTASPPTKQTRHQNNKSAASPLTQGRVNAVRAAFKAGITPARIARQFGLSQSDVRKAISSYEPRR
jgi:hypothetical protein